MALTNCLCIIIIALLFIYFYLSNELNCEKFTGSKMHVYYFYSDYCPHCTTMKPIWNELQKIVKNPNIMFHSIDMNDKNNNHLISKHNVSSMPTIIKTDDYGNSEKFNQKRDVKNIHSWLFREFYTK